MFIPRYTITPLLLANIVRVNQLVHDLNSRRFPRVILMEMVQLAQAVSAYASTSIEGNPLPLTEVKKILKSQPKTIRDSEREVLNYNQALVDVEQQLITGKLSLSLKLLLNIHRQVTESLLPKHEVGKWRKWPVVVNDPRTGKMVYLPPDVEEVLPLMKSLMEYVETQSNVVDPLILAGIFHKQMVLIHPFMDGNGRTTRLATTVLLAKMGLNTLNLFSFENYYNKNVTLYFQMVGEFGNYHELVPAINFTAWLEYFTGGLIDELLRVEKFLPTLETSPATRLETHHLKILEYVKRRGYITDRDYAQLTKRAKPTRTQDFAKLVELGLLERRGGGRSSHYILK